MNFQRDIANYPLIRKTYKRLHEKIFRYIPHDKFVIAGGFAAHLLRLEFAGEKTIKFAYSVASVGGMCRSRVVLPFGDIDIFLTDGRLTKKTTDALYDALPESKQYMSTQYSANFICPSLRFGKDKYSIPIQVIKGFSGQPKKILSGFDFTHVAVAFDGNYVYYTDETEEHNRKKVIVYNRRPKRFGLMRRAIFVSRLTKYHYRGFAVQDPQIIADLHDLPALCDRDPLDAFEDGEIDGDCFYYVEDMEYNEDELKKIIKFIPENSKLIMVNGELWRKL